LTERKEVKNGKKFVFYRLGNDDCHGYVASNVLFLILAKSFYERKAIK